MQDTVLQSHQKAACSQLLFGLLWDPAPHSNVKPRAARTSCVKSSNVCYNHPETKTSEQEVNKIKRQVSGIPSILELGIEMLNRRQAFQHAWGEGWATSEYVEIGHEEPNQSNNELAATAPLPI